MARKVKKIIRIYYLQQWTYAVEPLEVHVKDSRGSQ